MTYPPQDPRWDPQQQAPPPVTPGPLPHRPQQPAYPQPVAYGYHPQQAGRVTHTKASTGLPAWMHVLYALGGIPTCGLLWIVWAIHWWFAQSKSKATTVTQTSYYPPPPPGGPPPQYPQA